MKILRLRGFRLESLLSRSIKRGLRFSYVRRASSREMVVVSSSAHAQRLKAMAQEQGVTCCQEGLRGLDRAMALFRRRRTLALGWLLFFFLLYAFSHRIWMIRVEAADGELSPEIVAAITESLRGLGVSPGCALPDTELLARSLSVQHPLLAYVDARVTGACLLVSVTESDLAPDLYDSQRARDLVAERDGVILAINVLAGEAAVDVGDTVRAGDVLILGAEKISREDTRGVRALGTVTARVWNEATCESSVLQTITRPTGNVRCSSYLTGPFFRLPLNEEESYPAQQVKTERLQVVGMFLPLYIERITMYETENVCQTLDLDALCAGLKSEALRRAAQEAGDILRVWTETDISGENIRVRAVVESAAQIAVSR